MVLLKWTMLWLIFGQLSKKLGYFLFQHLVALKALLVWERKTQIGREKGKEIIFKFRNRNVHFYVFSWAPKVHSKMSFELCLTFSPSSALRFGHGGYISVWPDWAKFWKNLATNFIAKVAQIFDNFWKIVLSWVAKTTVATFWTKLG